MGRLLIFLLVAACASVVDAAEVNSVHIPPKQVGSREVVLEFSVDEKGNAAGATVISSEEKLLDDYAKALVLKGKVKDGAPGVVKIGENRYRAELKFPVAGDEKPLPLDVALPKARFLIDARFPFELQRHHVTGGALLKVSLDKHGRITKVELVRASEKAFGEATLTGAKTWEFFQPAKKGNEPINIVLFQLITFEFEDHAAPWQWRVSPEPGFSPFFVTRSVP